jgi:hypothetical protein
MRVGRRRAEGHVADVAAFEPTHAAPAAGLKTWVTAGGDPAADIPAGLEVQLAERQGDWAKVLCSNGWSTWVDGRELIDLAALRAKAAELVSRLGGAVKAYEQVVNDAVAQKIDQDEFKRRAVEAGTVELDGELWLLDLPNTRWYRYDGFSMQAMNLGEG